MGDKRVVHIVDDEETMNPVGAFGNKLEAVFNFVLGDNNAVSRVKRALQKVEIRQAGLFLNAVASAEAVATEDEKEEGVAVVDIGGGTTDVTVFYKNSVRHVGIVPMGGNAINRDIRSYGILERHVESLKVRYGSAMPLSFITVCTSAKSTFTVLSRVITSAMLLAAVAKISSALPNASERVSLP